MPKLSWNNNKDIFENTGQSTDDHIWPLAKDGSNNKNNIQLLTEKSNNEKGDRTKGKVNGIRFAITEVGRDDNDNVIGAMKIKNSNGDWVDVISN